jgi:hypothetical protein
MVVVPPASERLSPEYAQVVVLPIGSTCFTTWPEESYVLVVVPPFGSVIVNKRWLGTGP